LVSAPLSDSPIPGSSLVVGRLQPEVPHSSLSSVHARAWVSS
jgi:hypothetical protein